MTVKLQGRRYRVALEPAETILQGARRHGLRPPFRCTRGHCGTCMIRVVEGSVVMRDNQALTEEEVADGLALACQSEPATTNVTVEFLGGEQR